MHVKIILGQRLAEAKTPSPIRCWCSENAKHLAFLSFSAMVSVSLAATKVALSFLNSKLAYFPVSPKYSCCSNPQPQF